MTKDYLEGGIEAVAQALGVHVQTVYKHAQLRNLPFIKRVGSRYVVIEAAFEEWKRSIDAEGKNWENNDSQK
jgi:excisionase family DNA binding protein